MKTSRGRPATAVIRPTSSPRKPGGLRSARSVGRRSRRAAGWRARRSRRRPRHARRSAPSSQARRKPPLNESPAPVVSTGSTVIAGTRRAVRPPGRRAPRTELDGDDRPHRRADGTSPGERPGGRRRRRGRIRRASVAFGEEDVAGPSIAATPPSHRLGRVPVRVEGGRDAARPGGGEEAPATDRGSSPGGRSSRSGCGGPGQPASGTASTSIVPIVPISVRIARSRPLVRITVAPVERTGSTMQVETSIPRARSASSMNRPNGSSPTTPKKATRSWSRAAPQAKIADELPTVMWMDRTTRSTSSKTGTGSGSATTMSGLIRR